MLVVGHYSLNLNSECVANTKLSEIEQLEKLLCQGEGPDWSLLFGCRHWPDRPMTPSAYSSHRTTFGSMPQQTASGCAWRDSGQWTAEHCLSKLDLVLAASYCRMCKEVGQHQVLDATRREETWTNKKIPSASRKQA